ncbi:hypothetical protein HK405_010954, partial [Cladochytrium tenue]
MHIPVIPDDDIVPATQRKPVPHALKGPAKDIMAIRKHQTGSGAPPGTQPNNKADGKSGPTLTRSTTEVRGDTAIPPIHQLRQDVKNIEQAIPAKRLTSAEQLETSRQKVARIEAAESVETAKQLTTANLAPPPSLVSAPAPPQKLLDGVSTVTRPLPQPRPNAEHQSTSRPTTADAKQPAQPSADLQLQRMRDRMASLSRKLNTGHSFEVSTGQRSPQSNSTYVQRDPPSSLAREQSKLDLNFKLLPTTAEEEDDDDDDEDEFLPVRAVPILDNFPDLPSSLAPPPVSGLDSHDFFVPDTLRESLSPIRPVEEPAVKSKGSKAASLDAEFFEAVAEPDELHTFDVSPTGPVLSAGVAGATSEVQPSSVVSSPALKGWGLKTIGQKAVTNIASLIPGASAIQQAATTMLGGIMNPPLSPAPIEKNRDDREISTKTTSDGATRGVQAEPLRPLDGKQSRIKPLGERLELKFKKIEPTAISKTSSAQESIVATNNGVVEAKSNEIPQQTGDSSKKLGT